MENFVSLEEAYPTYDSTDATFHFHLQARTMHKSGSVWSSARRSLVCFPSDIARHLISHCRRNEAFLARVARTHRKRTFVSTHAMQR